MKITSRVINAIKVKHESRKNTESRLYKSSHFFYFISRSGQKVESALLRSGPHIQQGIWAPRRAQLSRLLFRKKPAFSL